MTHRGGLCVDGLVENEGIIDTCFLFQKQILHTYRAGKR